MVEYKQVVEFLNDEYPDMEDLFGLITDLVNGGCTPKELQKQIKEYIEHNE